jgi:hypothetical protein
MLRRGDPFPEDSPRSRLGKLIVWAGVDISLVRKIRFMTFAVSRVKVQRIPKHSVRSKSAKQIACDLINDQNASI